MLGKTSQQQESSRESHQGLEESGLVKGVESVKNGFVRPVAVASIFRPSGGDENSSKKPAVPEKRRFSTLIGDFTPCNDSFKPLVSNDEFARRRQSWDTRTTALPFGQNLLKKTPKINKDKVQATTTSKINPPTASNGFTETTSLINSNQESLTSSSQDQVSSSSCTNCRLDESVSVAEKPTVTTWNTIKTNSCESEESVAKVSSLSYKTEDVGDGCGNIATETTKRKVYGLLKPRNEVIVSGYKTKPQGYVDETSNDSGVTRIIEKKIQVNSICSTSESVLTTTTASRTNSPTVASPQHTTSTTNYFATSGSSSVTSEILKVGNSSAVIKNSNNVTESIKREIINNRKKQIDSSAADDYKTVSSVIDSKCQVPPKIDRSTKPSTVEFNNGIVPNISPRGKKTELSDGKDSDVPPCVKPDVKLRYKNPENQIEDMPKNVRLARRTSDLIANKIQSIFSKVNSEKEPPPPPPPVKVKPSNIDSQSNTTEVTNAIAKSTESSKNTVTSANSSKDVLKFIDTHKNLEKSTEVSKDWINSVDSSEVKSIGSSKNDVNCMELSKNVVKPIKLSKDTAKPIESSKNDLKSIEPSNNAVKSSEPSESTVKVIESPKHTVRPVEISKDAMKSVESSKGAVNSIQTSKDTVQIIKTSKDAVKSIETKDAMKCIEFSKDIMGSGETSKNGEKSTDLSKNVKSSNSSINNVEITDLSKIHLPSNISSYSIQYQQKANITSQDIPKSNVKTIRPKSSISLSITDIKKTKELTGGANGNIPIGPFQKVNVSPSKSLISSIKDVETKETSALGSTAKVMPAELEIKPNYPLANGLSFLNGVEDCKMIAAALRNNNLPSEEPVQKHSSTQSHHRMTWSDSSRNSPHIDTKTSSFVNGDLSAGHAEKSMSPSECRINGFQSPSFFLHPRNSDDGISKTESRFSLSSSSSTDISSSFPSEMGFRDPRLFTMSSGSHPYSPPPRPPERRRAIRDSSLPPPLPPHSASISRTCSLKRFEDSKLPPAVLRSPSHSCVPSYSPHRYSYTEMLSKVCSYGLTPSSSASSLPGRYSKYNNSSSLSQVSELWSDLTQEQTSSSHATEILEAETSERMRLEKEVQDLQSRYSHVQQKSDKMEMEMMEARVYRSTELNGDISGDEDTEGNSTIYKQKYERAVRDMEIMKRRVQQQHEEVVEQNLSNKKASDKKLAEALEDVEEERQVANQWKRKAQKLGSELQDLRLMLEEQMARNGELEKKQRKFDSELSACQEEIKKERVTREKATRERDQSHQEKYSLEQELHSTRLDMDMQHEKITQLNRELDELSLSSKGEEEVTQLKRSKQELERKLRDQEEELEELAGQVQMLEQAKLRLEMSLEKLRQEHRRESSVREEEIEELRASFSKKIKNLEAQLETEQEDRHQLVKQKHELERRVIELTDQPPPQDPEIERRLRRDLKRTKALLRDAQSMLEHVRDGQGNKSIIRQLKNQLEDAEFAKCAAIKAKQTAEMELQDSQLQLEEVTRTKNESESKCLQLSREKSTIQTQLEEMEEELTEVMKKFKASVAQLSIEQKTIAEQNQQITELEMERHALKEQLSDVSTKFEHLAGQSEDTSRVYKLDARVRDLESKLDLEQTTRGRLEHQITRLKEQIDRLQEECDNLRNKELQAQEGIRRFQRQMRDLREDYTALQQKEAEAYRKQHDLELALENAEGDLKVTKNDLRLACQRIEELKNALEDDLDSGTDVPDDSGSESDSSSLDMSMLRHRMSSIQRCDSAASDLSFGSRRSITPSLGQEFSAMCSRDDVESEINGFSHLGESKLAPDSPSNQENLEV